MRDYVFPAFRANAIYEGQYLLGTSIARPLIAKRQMEIAALGRGRRGQPRRHRQGQRPGAVRTGLPGHRPAHQDHRPLAGVGPQLPHGPDGLCRKARHRRAHHPRQALQHGPEPAAHQLRGRDPGRPLAGTARGHVHPHRFAPEGPGHARNRGDRIPHRRPGGRQRRRAVPGRPAARTQPAGRTPRHRPGRPGGEPVRGDEIPGRLRNPGRDHSAGGPHGRGVHHHGPGGDAPAGTG